jgi:uncharacterized protein YcbK (DUF882 family)
MGITTYSYAKDKNKKLSTHFSVGEFASLDSSGKLWSDSVLIHSELINTLEKVATTLNCSKIIISSGYRTPVHDKKVGGSGSGQHTIGFAADFICYDKDNRPIPAKTVCCTLEDFGNIYGIGYIGPNSTHVDVRASVNKWWGDETIDGSPSIWRVKPGCNSFYTYWGIAKPTPAPTQPASNSASIGPNPAIIWDNQYDAQVKELQSILISKGKNIAADGYAGPNTYAAVNGYTIEKGDKGPLTKWVQSRLNTLGYNCGTADGIAGNATMTAIGNFQKAYGLGVGYLGGTDWYYIIK